MDDNDEQGMGEQHCPQSFETGTAIRDELMRVIRRWGGESDVTLYQALGALRMCEHDLIRILDQHDRKK